MIQVDHGKLIAHVQMLEHLVLYWQSPNVVHEGPKHVLSDLPMALCCFLQDLHHDVRNVMSHFSGRVTHVPPMNAASS